MTTEAFWDEKHRASDIYWLTGSTLPQLAALYQLTLTPGDRATEVGVGTGSCTRGLVQAGYEVSAVDVSRVALSRVNGVAPCYHVDDLAQVPAADLALCHLVFQHASDEQVQRILATTPLAPGGIFAFQTAWMTAPAVGLKDDMHGLIWHTWSQVRDMAERARLQVFWERSMAFVIKGDTVLWGIFKARRLT